MDLPNNNQCKPIHYFLFTIINISLTASIGYFLTGKLQANLFKIETKSKALSSEINFLTFISTLTPKYKIDAGSVRSTSDNEREIILSIKNLGKYDIFFEVISLKIFRKVNDSSGIIEIPIEVISTRSNLKTNLETGNNSQQGITFIFKNKMEEKGAFYFEIIVKARTNNEIIQLSRKVAKKNDLTITDSFFSRRTKLTGTYDKIN